MKRKVQRGILHVILYTFVLIMMVPLIWLVVISSQIASASWTAAR